MKKYDVIILGAGPGGYVAAIKAAQLGLKVGLMEEHKLGGICLNYGCVPTKTLLKTARLYLDILKASEFGIDIKQTESVSINWDKMMERKNKVVTKLVSGVGLLIKGNKIDLIQGHGTVIDKNSVQVEGKAYNCDNLVLAAGSSSSIPNIPGIKEAFKSGKAIDSTGAIALKERPKTLTILGGGVIAIEFATLYQSLGTQVTLLQRSSKILRALDYDVQALMQKELTKLGVKTITDVDLKTIEGSLVNYEINGMKHTLESDFILVSLGRKPNVRGLESLDLEINRKGVVTNEYMETNIKGVYAIGDMNGKYMLAHVASAEGIIAAEAIAGKKETINYNKIPSCIYSFPEVGVVGLTEEEAVKGGYDVKTSKFMLTSNAKALAEGECSGFVKIISDGTYGEILGVHIVASHATDMIAEAAATMELEGTVHDLAKTVHPHPTLSEIVMEAAHGAVDQPIHAIRK
ncbi:MAG: dihydrolipoyl dehydrogenase [Alkaliphilus sp.]